MIKAIFFLSIISYWNVIGGPPPIIAKITFTEEELVIDGTQLEDTKSVSIRTLENKILKDFEVDNPNPEKIVARPMDGSFEPGDKNLYLVITDSEGELFYPITLRSKTSDQAVYKITQKKNEKIPNKIVVDEKSEINFSPGDNSGRYYYNYSIYANQAGDLAIKNEDKDLFKIDQEGNLEIAGTLKVKGKTLKFFNTLNFENQLFSFLPPNQREGDFRVKDVVIGEDNNISGVINFTSLGIMDVATATFHVDSANGRIGIGNATPTYKLDVQGSTNSGIRLKQAAASTNTSGAFFNGMVFEELGGKSFGIGYGAGDLFSINSFDGTYRNIFSLNNVGNGVISGSLKVGAYTLPATDGTNGQVLSTNGAGVASWTSGGAGLGDVVGPASSTVDNLSSFSTGTGKVIKDSGINSANLPTMGVVATAPNQIIISTGPGKQFTTTLYPIPVAIGASDTVLKSDGTGASWQPEVSVANFIAGPATSTQFGLARYQDGTGKILKDSPVVMDDAGNFNFLRAVSTTAGSHPCPSMTTAQRTALTVLDGDCVFDTDLKQTYFRRMTRWGDVPVREPWVTGQPYKKDDLVQTGPFTLFATKDFTAGASVSDDFFNSNIHFPSVLPVTTCTNQGGEVILNGGNFDVMAGNGMIVTMSSAGNPWPDFSRVKWNNANSVPPAIPNNWNTVYVDKDGLAHIIAGKPTPSTLRTQIVLAVVNPSLSQVEDHRGPCFDQGTTVRDLNYVLGPLKKGFEYFGNANLTMGRNAGEIYSPGINFAGQNQSIQSFSAQPTASISYYFTRNARQGGTQTNLDPNRWDNGPGLTSTTNNRWTYQRIYLVAGGVTAVQYGQREYATLNAAISGITTDSALFVENPNLSGNAKWIASIVLQEGTTALNNTTQNAFLNCGIFGCGEGGGGGGSSGGGGGGDVFGPVLSITNNFAAFSDTSGNLIKDSGINSTDITTMATGTVGANQIIISAGAKALSSTIYQIPPAIGASGTVLKSDGTNASWQVDESGLSGTVVGPATSTLDAISSFAGTDGKSLKSTAFYITGNYLIGPNVVIGDNTGAGAGLGCFSHSAVKDDYSKQGFCQDSNGNSSINSAGGLTLDLKVGGNIQLLIGEGTTTNQNDLTNNGKITSSGNLTIGVSDFFVDTVLDQVGIGTATPNISALLDLNSSTKGLLLPRMDTTARNAIGVDGLLIYNTTTKSFDGYSNGAWKAVGAGSSTVNDQTGTTYTLAASDCGNSVYFNNATGVTVSVPALTPGCEIDLVQIGAGQVTVTGSGITVGSSFGLFKTRALYSVVTVKLYNASLAVLAGDLN